MRRRPHRYARQHAANFCTVAWEKVQYVSRHARLMKQLRRAKCDQWRLLRRFRQHSITGSKGRCNLTRKYCQWKIPGTDADKYTAPSQSQCVAFPARTGKFNGCRKPGTAFDRVVTQKIDGFPQFGDGVSNGLARLFHA